MVAAILAPLRVALAVGARVSHTQGLDRIAATPDFHYINDDRKVRPGGRVQLPPARPSFATQAATRATGLFWRGQKHSLGLVFFP